MTMQIDWELSSQFVSDSQGIRCACVLPPLVDSSATASNDADADDDTVDNYRIVTGNQGGGLCEFGVPSGSLRPIEYQHNHGVTAILSSSSSSSSTDNFYVTGCKDNAVRVFDSTSHELKATLKGHEKPVTSMSFVTTGRDSSACQYLVTGSWDGTAKVWDVHRQALLATLTGHENSTCVTGLIPTTPTTGGDQSSGDVIKVATGSAGIAQSNQITGHTVRIWSINVRTGQVQCVNSVADDHEGPIRDIRTLGGGEPVATCSNDGTVRLRSTVTGESLSTLTFRQQQQQSSQHPPMLLSVAPILEGNNDTGVSAIVSSAEDGHVIVWNYQNEDDNNLTTIEPQVIAHPSCVWNVIGLPKGDFATCCQDGTLRIFTKAANRMAPESEKELFAQTAQEATTKKNSGPSSDEVAKLPPWETNLQKRGTSEGQVQLFKKNNTAIAAQWSMASQTWIEVGQVMGSADGGAIDGVQYDHVLPIEVDQTGGGVAKLQIGYNNGENQFVAAQRFIDAYMLPQHHLNDIANYIQQRVGNQTPTLGTEEGTTVAANSSSSSGVPMITYEHLPMPACKSFELSVKSATTTLEKMKKKIEEHGLLSDSQLVTLSNLMDTLGSTNRYHSSKIELDELKLISDMLETFPQNQAFPALDLARLTVAHPDGASSSNVTYWNGMICKVLSLCADTSDLDGPAATAIPMLSLRFFVNAFRGGPGSLQAITSQLEAILRCNEKFIASKNKSIRLSVATLLFNVAFYIYSNKDAASSLSSVIIVGSNVVLQVDKILQTKVYETEALIRSLVALGTVVVTIPEAKETAKTEHVVSRVEMSASSHGDLAKSIAKEVYNVIA